MKKAERMGDVHRNSLQGHFLLAAPHQLDPHFVESVILVVEHADRGAFGVIVNCPSERYEAISRPPSARRSGPDGPRLHFGGPVIGPRMAVHGNKSFGEIELLPGVFFSGRRKNVRALMRPRQRTCKVFTGYTGWGPGQLEHEVESGIWRTAAATAADVFSHSDDLWETLLKRATDSLLAAMCNIKHIPADVSLN